jgi:catechol 2,3-dioxygenase-like lactoylglutathione lyase family enzyme
VLCRHARRHLTAHVRAVWRDADSRHATDRWACRGNGGRGVYFDTPDGNLFELITQPYGAVPESLGRRDAAQVG